MNIKILFRGVLAEQNELDIAKKYFTVIESRADVRKNNFIIARYSSLPYYKEFETDITKLGGRLINSYRQYKFAADLQNWYDCLDGITPKTWFRAEDVPISSSGPFILKGETNSRKQLWKTSMFAPTRADIGVVLCNLLNDSLLQHQNIYVRQCESLINYGEDPISHCPISKEFRIFILNGIVLAKGFYWSNFYNDIFPRPNPDEIPEAFIQDVIKRIDNQIPFYSLDVAQKIDGSWVVIEIGDGQMSGPSCCNLDELYGNIKNNLCIK